MFYKETIVYTLSYYYYYYNTFLMAHIINWARSRERSLVITLLELKNAFGEVHHNLIGEVLRYHHVPNHVQQLISALYTDFETSIITRDLNTPFLPVGRGVLQGKVTASVLSFSICALTHLFNTLKL